MVKATSVCPLRAGAPGRPHLALSHCQLSGAEPGRSPESRASRSALSPQVIENCVAAAGFSVGEFAALVFAGAMEFSEGTQKGVCLVQGCCLAGLTGDKEHGQS